MRTALPGPPFWGRRTRADSFPRNKMATHTKSDHLRTGQAVGSTRRRRYEVEEKVELDGRWLRL